MRVDYAGVQKGWAVVGGKKCYFQSKYEQRWAEYLEFLENHCAIVSWSYEPHTFWFESIKSGTRSYKPDFEVWDDQDTKCWHECKGYLTQKDITKFRRMAKYYPDEKIVLVMQRLTGRRTKLLLESARRYVYRVMDGEKILKGIGL